MNKVVSYVPGVSSCKTAGTPSLSLTRYPATKHEQEGENINERGGDGDAALACVLALYLVGRKSSEKVHETGDRRRV